MPQKHILIVGKSPLVLQSASHLLRERNYNADITDNFDTIATRFDLSQIDLILLGGQVPPEKKIEIKQIGQKFNPNVLFVDGLAGIPGLLVQQIESAFTMNQHVGHAPLYDSATRSITLVLDKPADTKITGWWQTTSVPPNPGSDSRIITDELLAAGKHTIALPDFMPVKASFITVQLGGAIYNLACQASPAS